VTKKLSCININKMNTTTFIYFLLGAAVGLVLQYLDTKIADNPRTRADYFKGMMATGVTAALVAYLTGANGVPGMSGSKYIPALDEDIFTGLPDF